MRILDAALAVFASFAVGTPAKAATPWLLPNFSDRVEFQVQNNRAGMRSGIVVLNVHDVATMAAGFPGTFAIAMQPAGAGKFLPMQVDDLDGDGKADEVAIQVEVPAHASEPVEIYYSQTLHDSIPWPQQVHASHAYGYNHETATIESTLIGYRTYGGFLFDVQAHRGGQAGLFNSLLGYSRTGSPPAEGRDVVHYGQTLGLGGLFLQQGAAIYTPPFNTPTYTHRAPADTEPVYCVLAEGPLRAIISASLPAWHAGPNVVALRGVYEMRANETVLRATVQLTPMNALQPMKFGVGVLTLPAGTAHQTDRSIVIAGMQNAGVGQLALGIAFQPDEVLSQGKVITSGGENRTAMFSGEWELNQPMERHYRMAAAWSGSGSGDVTERLQNALQDAEEELQATGIHHSATPNAAALQGEPL